MRKGWQLALKNNRLEEEIESWKGFPWTLRKEDLELWDAMVNQARAEFGDDEGNSTIYIKDNRTNRVAGVTIRGKDLMCDVDKRNDCVHVGFTYALPQAYRAMEKLGIRPPKVK